MTKKRLSKYGEVYREKVDDATIVVRAIFQSRKGDSYHVRILKGEGKQEDEKKQGSVLWRDDFYIDNDDDPKNTLRSAIKAAKDWIKSPTGKKKTKTASRVGDVLHTDRIANLINEIQTLIQKQAKVTPMHFERLGGAVEQLGKEIKHEAGKLKGALKAAEPGRAMTPAVNAIEEYIETLGTRSVQLKRGLEDLRKQHRMAD